jgi:hypothetical protein
MLLILRIALVLSLAPAALASSAITGSVQNQTRGQPAVGDEVILICLDQARLDQGMQEEQRTRTDARGRFSLRMQDPDKAYLVRVKHQNVNYDERAPAGGVITIPVFDAADDVPGISGTIEIWRAGTTGKSLHVSDMVEVKNASSPPITLVGEHTFEVYLPANAKLDSVLAAGPEKIPVMVSAAPLSGKPGHYAVNLPLQPGTTKFAFNYDLPYEGYAAFRTWHAYSLQQLAIMLPTTMKFSSLSSKFQILRTGASNYQVRAVGPVMAGQGPTITISGTGQFPSLPSQAKPQESSTNTNMTPLDPHAGPASGHSNSNFGTLSSWPMPLWVLAGCVFFVSCTLIAWRACNNQVGAARGVGIQSSVRRTGLLDSVKDELLELESNRIRGSISEEEYACARQALEQIVARAVAGRPAGAKRD